MTITLNGTGTIFTNANADIGIGTSSPNTYGTNIRTVDVEGSAGAGIKFGTGTANAYFGAYYMGGSTNTAFVQTFNSSPIVFAANNAEVMRITPSGTSGTVNVTGRLLVYSQGSTNLTGFATNAMVLGTVAKNVSGSGGQGIFYICSDDPSASALFGSMQLVTDPTAGNRRLTINCVEQGISYRDITINENGAGNLLVGTYAPSSTTARIWNAWDSSTQQGMVFRTSSTTFNGSPLLFYNSSLGISGSISQSASAISYNTTSDYRLKENVRPLTSSIDTINALNPVAYDWKIDSTYGEGFIAHELQEHIPLAVNGKKDAVDEEGKMKPQAVDYSKIVVHLVAAMQEQQKQIEELKNKISILEAK